METGINFAPVEVSQYDIDALSAIRKNVRDLIRRAAAAYDSSTLKVLDIAPAEHGGAKEFFKLAEVKTLDIDYRSNPDYVADITHKNKNFLYTSSFGLVVCTEVLEHTLNPFAAIAEISRILKPGGILIASAPYNFRTHGPLPDCWRFSEHGWRALLDRYDIQELKPLESDRPLFPLHYTIIAKKQVW